METAVLKVLLDILSALDTGNIPMLTLLDLSAAFDSVDHNGMHPLFRHPLFRHPLFRHLCLLCILAKYTH